MKRQFAFCILLMMVSLCVKPSFAEETIDYGSLSDEALTQILQDARIEWTKRELRDNDEVHVALDSHGVQLAFHGTYGFLSPYQKEAVYLDYTVINTNDFAVTFTLNDIKLNGWSGIPFAGFYQVDPNSKKIDKVGFYLEYASVKELSDLEDLTFTINCVNNDTLEIIDSAQVIIIFSQMTERK